MPGEVETSLMVPPPHIGGVFEQGKYGVVREMYWHELVSSHDVTDTQERRAWCFENIGAYIKNGEEYPWKRVVDDWISDLDLAVAKAPMRQHGSRYAEEYRVTLQKEAEKTKDLIIAMMAVSSSARAMEQSGGAAAKYVAMITSQSPNGQADLDKQDSWKRYLLANDPEKLNTVIDDPLVRHYYDKLLRDAGIGNVTEWEGKKTRSFDINIAAARSGMLARYLKGNAQGFDEDVPQPDGTTLQVHHNGGFDGYVDYLVDQDDERFRMDLISDGLVTAHNEDDLSLRRAAAKLACDAFLVDKFTEWEYKITGENQDEEEVYGKNSALFMFPTEGWGGDPLRAILEPSFLPRRIKKVYSGQDGAILDMADEAFRPSDIFGLPGETALLGDKVIPPSMACHLKNYARYNDALWRFVGGSRAGGIPQWSDKTMGEELPSMAELLDQVYGGIDIRKDIEKLEEIERKRALNDDEKRRKRQLEDLRRRIPRNSQGEEVAIGKHIVGAMITRILEAKALALTSESLRPNWQDNFQFVFGEKQVARPFYKIEEFIWGKDRKVKDGFLVSLASGRTRIVFQGNLFGAEKTMTDVWQLISTNDQDPNGRNKAKTLHILRALAQSAAVISKNMSKR